MPVAQPVVVEHEDLARRGDPSDGRPRRWKSDMILVGAALAGDRLDRGPAHQWWSLGW